MPDLIGPMAAYFSYTGPIDYNGVSRLAAAFNQAVNGQFDEVHLSFNSLGGSVADGIFLHNHIKGLPIKTTIHNTGSVASIAVAIFAAAGTRYCSKHSMFLIHPTSFSPTEKITAMYLQSTLDSALAEDSRTEEVLREATAIPPEVLADRRIRDVHITPSQALAYGLVHEVREFLVPKGSQIIQV